MYQMLCDGLDRTGVSLSDSSLAENTPPVVCLSLFTCIYTVLLVYRKEHFKLIGN